MNFGTPVPLLLGIILILFAVFLFFLERFKPGYKRDSDVVYAFLALSVGILSLVDLGATLQHSLQSVIFTGMFVALIIESIGKRTPDNTPKSGGGPRDYDLPPRNYRAGFEENYGAMGGLDDREPRRQVRGDRRDDLDDRSSRRRTERDRYLEDRPPSRRRARPEDDYPTDLPTMDAPRRDRRESNSWEDEPPAPRSIPSRSSAPDLSNRGITTDEVEVPRPRRRRPVEDSKPRRSPSDEPPADYVDFRPVEPPPPKESWGPTADEA
ncbi:Ycf66 family protein [Alkalinema pantanalense CENA528]|uniref:Ycf66 family protein n=1 Tax=Alkalinema pantanalense TaxID=1620705 RepID=UPI003D6DAB5E